MEEIEFSKYRNPTEYLKIFFRRKWFFIVPGFLGIVLGIVFSFLLPPVWESSTIILVEEEKIINPLIQNLAVSTTAAQRMQSIREIILGWNSLVELTKKLNLAKNIQNQAEFENLIMRLRRNIGVHMRQQNIIKIAYQGKNPQETQLVAKTLTDILVEKNMQSQTKETDVAINFIKEQLAIYKRKIKESEIAKLHDQLKSLLADSTEQHPLVKDLRQKIATAEKELESGDYQVTGMEQAVSGPAREALKQELDKIVDRETTGAFAPGTLTAEAASADPNTAIYKLILMDKIDSSLARDINVNENIYNMLLQKLETAKITKRLETSREGTRYTVLDPPRLPLKPVKPNKILVIFIGFFLGSACGVGIVFAGEFMDQSFLDVEDVKHSLKLPVLGAISRIVTQEQIDKERQRKRTFIVLGLIVSAVVIVAAMLYSFLK